jgi:hypothetical protein
MISRRMITSGMMIMREERIIRQTIKIGIMGTIRKFRYFFSWKRKKTAITSAKHTYMLR